MSRSRLRRIGGNLFIVAIVLFAGIYLAAGLTGSPTGIHDEGGEYACLTMLLCVALVCTSILCWVVSLFLPKGLDEQR